MNGVRSHPIQLRISLQVGDLESVTPDRFGDTAIAAGQLPSFRRRVSAEVAGWALLVLLGDCARRAVAGVVGVNVTRSVWCCE